MADPRDHYLTSEGAGPWTNHHGTVTVKVAAKWQIVNENQSTPTMAGMKATAARLQRLIAYAVEQKMRLRAIGSRWSFSEIAAAENGWALNTQRLNYHFAVGAGSLDAAFTGNRDDLYLAQCGRSLAEINRVIEAAPRLRSLRTSGASNGQTIAGAIGTGTHGSALEVGALESQVAGIQLLTAKRNLWVEHPDHPTLSAAFAARLGAELVRDARLFRAALVSLGALGIVHAVLVRVTERYRLRSFLRQMPMAQILPAMHTLDFAGVPLPLPAQKPYFFQVVIDPAKPDTGHVTTRYKEACPADYVTKGEQQSGYEVGNDLPGFFGGLLNAAPVLRPVVVSAALLTQLAPFENKLSTPAETYTYTKSQSGTCGASNAVPAARIGDALAEAIAAYQQVKDAPAAFACRFAQPSPALLGWSRFGPSCMMDVDGLDTPAMRKLIEAVRVRFETAGIPYCAHWGKLHGLTKARVEASYGDHLPDWHAAREALIPDADERRVFSTALLETIGIHR